MSDGTLSCSTPTTSPEEGPPSPVIVNMFKCWGTDGTGLTQEWTVLELSALDANLLRSAVTSAVAPNGFATKIYAKFPRNPRTIALAHRL